jgi:hypothetical protein
MKEIYPNLFIGNQNDYERAVSKQHGWQVIHAAREPYHRAALGYTGRGAPKDHPEYLIARRGNRLILNLLDANSADYIPSAIITAALEFMNESLNEGKKILVHCNQGHSRSPVLGFLYLLQHTDEIKAKDFRTAEQEFQKKYPDYSPRPGMREVARQHFIKSQKNKKLEWS